jgi:hypothetical protein
MLRASKLGKALFKLTDLRTQYPLAAFDGGVDCLDERFAEAAALRLQIDKRDGFRQGWAFV